MVRDDDDVDEGVDGVLGPCENPWDAVALLEAVADSVPCRLEVCVADVDGDAPTLIDAEELVVRVEEGEADADEEEVEELESLRVCEALRLEVDDEWGVRSYGMKDADAEAVGDS